MILFLRPKNSNLIKGKVIENDLLVKITLPVQYFRSRKLSIVMWQGQQTEPWYRGNGLLQRKGARCTNSSTLTSRPRQVKDAVGESIRPHPPHSAPLKPSPHNKGVD